MSSGEKHTLNTNLCKTSEYETGRKIVMDLQRWRRSLDKKRVNGLSPIAFFHWQRLRAKKPSLTQNSVLNEILEERNQKVYLAYSNNMKKISKKIRRENII